MDCRQSILAFLNLRAKTNKDTMSTPTIPTLSATQQQALHTEPTKNEEKNSPQAPPEPKPAVVVAAKPKTFYFTIHGLDDFTSLEAKLLRTRRRLEHCYNVLYHQWILQQLQEQRRNVPVQIGAGPTHNGSTSCADGSRTISTDQAILLQQIAQLSSFESLRLALFRGQSSNIVTTVH